MEQQIRKELHDYNHLISEINGLYHALSNALGVSDSVGSILYAICEYGGECQQSDIYKLSGMSRQTVNSAIRKLEKDDIVYLKPGKGRNTVVCLTEKGRVVSEQIVSPVFAIENSIFEEWTEEEIAQYLRLTQKYCTGLKNGLSHLEQFCHVEKGESSV